MSSSKTGAFVTTQWTQVLQARGRTPEARMALGDLCEAYYAPVFTFIRGCERDEERVKDLTQDFFARLLAGGAMDTVDPNRGRFRSFLLGATKHFLADCRDRERASKRGGGELPLPLDEQEIACPPPPDIIFDRQWALTVLDRALRALADEHKAAGKSDQFEALKPWLTGDTELLSQHDAGTRLGLTDGAVKVAVHRLRKRFRELVKVEIGGTMADPAHIQDELRYLLEVLA